MTESKLISVAMAIYNGERYCGEQIESILSQSHQNLELVVSDDGSTDRSHEISSRFAAGDSRVRVVRNPLPPGVASNFYNALSVLRGNYICFADQDDVWRKDKLSILSNLLGKDPQNVLAYSDLEVCDESLRETEGSFWKLEGIRPLEGQVGARSLLRNLAPGCSMMFRRSVAELMLRGGYTNAFLHDHLAFAIASLQGVVRYTSERLVRYRQHDANVIGAHEHPVYDRNGFIRNLLEKIDYLERLLPADTTRELPRLRVFVKQLVACPVIGSPAYLPYYFYQRRSSFKDGFLALLEGLSPFLYHRLRKVLKGAHA